MATLVNLDMVDAAIDAAESYLDRYEGGISKPAMRAAIEAALSLAERQGRIFRAATDPTVTLSRGTELPGFVVSRPVA